MYPGMPAPYVIVVEQENFFRCLEFRVYAALSGEPLKAGLQTGAC
jgi:hypothetical protein